jgi:hypothetical protein
MTENSATIVLNIGNDTYVYTGLIESGQIDTNRDLWDAPYDGSRDWAYPPGDLHQTITIYLPKNKTLKKVPA